MEETTNNDPVEDEDPGYDRAAIVRDYCLGLTELSTLDLMERQLAEFITFQLYNKESLIETGLRKTIFFPSIELDRSLSNLYFTRLPYGVEVMMQADGQLSIEYEWLDGWPLMTNAPRFAPEDLHNGWDGFAYMRRPEMEWWPHWLKLPSYPKSTKDWKKAHYAPFLSRWDTKKIESEGERNKLFETRLLILQEALRSLHNRKADQLWGNCLNCINRNEINLEFYGQIDWQYRFMKGVPYTEEDLVLDKWPGGFTALMGFIISIEQALKEPEWDSWANDCNLIRKQIGSKGLDLWHADYKQFIEAAQIEGFEFETARQAVDSMADWIAYFVNNTHVLTHERWQAMDIDVEVQMPSIFTSRELAPVASKGIASHSGCLTDYAKDAINKNIEMRSPNRSGQQEDKPGLYWSSDCSGVCWIRQDKTKENWSFFKEQAAGLRILRDAYLNGSRYVNGDYIVEQSDTKKGTMKELFGSSEAWQTLIKGGNVTEGGNKKGQYYLDP